jgi:hypothetical protein
MSAQDDMIAAVNAVEVAAGQLAAAYTNYLTAYKTAASAVRAMQGGDVGLRDVAALEHAVGPERFAQFASGRLVALGAARLLAQAQTPAGPEVGTWLIGQIEHLVPEAAARTASG